MADLNKIYNALREKGVVTKSYEEFANAMADGNKRKNVYNALAQQGLITKSYKQFSDAVAPSHAPQTTQSTSTAPRNNDWVKQGLSVLKGVPSMPTPNIPSYRPTPLKPSEQNFDEIIANGFVYKDDNTYNSVVSGLDERIKQAQQQYDALLKQHSQNVKKGRKEASFWERLGAMPDVDDVPTKTSDDVLTPESDQLRAARETLHRLQNTRVQLERGRESKTQGEELDKRKKNGSGLLERAAYKTAISLENFGKGFMDALRGSDMWATNDAANDLMAVKNIVHKVDKWNALTDKEKSAMTSDDLLKVKPTDEELEILNNYALAYNVNAQAQDPISSNWSYKAGGVSANSALFGIEMAASGGMNVSSSAGRAIEKGALKLSQKAVKNGLEKLVGKTFEKSLARKIAGGVGQLPVQFGMGALESTVLQNGLTERKAQEYEIGTPLMSMDENGALRYSGSLGKLDAKGAHNRALVEQTIENQTEMLGGQIGEVLGGLTKVGVKVLNKMKLGENITKLMTDVSSNQFNRIMNNALNTAGYNGFLGEYLEEHAGDVEQALFLGTMTFDTDPETGIYNKEHILETMSGLAPMMGGHMVMEGTSYGASRARMAMMLSMAERKGSKLFGDERWAQVKQSLGGLDNQQFADKLSSMLQDKTLSDKQKKAVYNYAFYEKARQGFELMSLKQDMEGAVSLIDKNSRTNFVIGYKKGGQAAGELLTNLQKAQRNLRVRLGDYGYRQLFEENGDDFNKAYNSGMLDTDQKKQAYLDYVNALSCYQGALQRLHNDKKSELVNAKTDVDNIMDEQGNIVSATTTDGKKVNIVNGNVVLNEDGSVNVEKSGSLVVVDSDGKRKMISASEVASVDSVTKASDVLAQKNKEIVDKYATEEMSQKIQVGAQLPILTPNGSVIATIVSVNEDGSVSFKMGDSENIITTDAYNLYVMNLNAEVSSALREDDDAEQSTESVPEVATEGERPLTDVPSPAEESREYAQGDVFDVVVDGNKMHAEIVSPKDADGRFVVNVDDGESMRTLYVTPEELAAMEYREEPSTKAEETRLATEDSSDKALERGAQPTEEHAPTALERIPRDEKGNAQFHDVDTETAWDGLVEMSGNEETAHKVAEASLANAEKRLKAAKALKEKGETPEELLRSIKENEAAVAEAQRVVDAWKAIVGEKARREEAAKAEAERKAAEERERAEAEEKRIAEEKAEAERKAQEERERAEEERDRIEAELDAQKADEEARLEAERKAEEEAVEKDAELKEDKKKPQLKDVVKAIYEKGKSAASRLYKMAFFDVAKTPDFMKKLGLTGDRFTIKYGVLSRHAGKDDSHSLTEKQWEELPDALQKPFAITRFGGKDKGYRLYTTMKNENGETIVVGVDVKNVGRDMEVNAISTIFGRRGDAKKTQKEDVLYTAENITPEQRSLLGQPNSDQYTGVRERNVSTDKGSEKAEKKQKKQSVFDKAKEIADKEEKKRKAEDNSVLGQATRAVGKKKKVNLFKYTASEKNSNSALRGVHYANGYAYASDGYILFKEKADYPKEWEGTTRDKDGNLIDGKYPDAEKAIPRLVHIPDKEVESLPSKEVLDFAIAASKKLKGEAIPVAIDGLFFNAVNLKKFLEAVASKGMDKVVYRHPMLYATNGKDEIVMMPTVNTLEGALDIADRMESAGLPKEQIDAWKAHIEAADKKMSFEDFKKAVENAKKEGVRPTEADKQESKAEAEKQKVDKQGNPIDAEGRLITEKVEDISDLSDDDFNNPKRSVELPKIPKNIDNALGANGKPVIIKKNIFERNKNAHSDLTAEQSREILKTALYSADLYAKNQKSKRPFNWVIIKTKDHDGKNKLVLLEVNDNKDNVEIVHWHYLDDRGLEKIKKQAEREGGQLLILPSEKEEAGALSSRTSDLPADKGSEVGGEKQEAEKKRPAPLSERIEDVGEKIGDARKDVWKEIIARIKNKKQGIEEALKKSSAGKLFSSLFDEKELLESGVSNEVVTFISAVKGSLGTKPRSLSKLKMWINKVLHQYDMCEQALENWESVKKKIDEWKYYSQPFYMYRAAMAVGGYESGRDVGNAELWQIADGYSDGKSVAGQWCVRKAGAYDGIYKTYEEAAEALKKFAGENAAVDGKGKRKEVKLAIYKRRTDGTMFIAPEGKPDVIIQDGFKTLYEASAYKKEHYAEMQERYRTLMDGIKPKFNENRERKGRDWRGGKDVSAEDFREAFDFRGVEFGNWMQQKDRHQALNECYDSLMDLAMVCGVSPKALSLGGKLAMAFGARGGGKFNAHYEPDKVVINLTKTKGAGSLAHEWFHAIDNYFNMQGWDEFATESTRNVERKEMAEAWKDLVRAINGSDYFKRSDKYARLKGSRYWIEPTELGARAFAVWVENRLSKYGTINDYLANNPRLVDEKASDAEKKYAPYPFDKDADWMDEKFGRLFEVMQERVDEETGKHILYSRNKAAGHEKTELTAEERELRDNLVERMRKGGLDVVTDSEEMQRVIDTENERTRMMGAGSVREHRVYHGSGADFDAFDHSHMGEGEGAQAYGWGTYVTEVEGIGRTYAIQNTTKHNDALRALQHDVDAISDQLNRHRDDLKYDEEQLKRANEWRAEAELDYELFKDEAEELKEKYGESSPKYRNHLFNDIYTDEMKRAQSSVKSMEESIQYRKEKIAELEKALKDKQAEIDELPKEFPRHLYTVEIPDDNGSNYLDWNGHPAESLLKDVGSFLESEGFERVQDNPVRYEKGESTVVLNPNATGADLYAELREVLGSDKKASQALAELGCIGIKYPADNMRGGREDGAKNYVIFNENDAKITDHTRFLRTADGEVYGLVKDGRIYLDPKVATAETAVHEYTHLWGDMLRRKDSEQWSHTVKELKNSVLWEEVKELYPELKTDDEIADEVLSTFSGRRGAERLREEARRVADGEGGVFTKAKAIETLERVKEAIARFWEGVARMFGINRYRSAEELADMAMKDLLDGVDPRKMGNNEKGIGFSAKQKRALETVTMADKSTNKATAISSADGAKVQNNLEILAESYNNRSNKTKGFITDLSQALNLERHEASHYGTFETQKGKLVTIRVSNHNARVSLFDKNGENDGISIVISNHKNKGLLNDGNAHIIEFFYSKQSLQRADGKPLSDIIRSVSEVLYSGEFKDTTGLAERQEVNGDDVIRFQFIGEKGAAEADHAEEVFANENVERSVRENPKSEEPRFSRKPGESIFDYASRVSEDGLLFRDGGTEYDFPGEDDAQKLYNAAVDGRKSRAIESWQDEMFPVKMLQEAIEKATGEKIADFENAYLLENQLGSAGNATLEKYAREVQNPMRKVYLDMLKAKFDGGSKVTKSDINKYVIAVHGLERNKYMADKNKGLPDARRDYSGFTALFGNGEQVEVEELERRAEEYIGKFEDAVGKDKADKLWSLVDESRQRTLDELVRSGLVSGDVADEWLRRFEHYVPLQGFSEEVIGEDRNANFENHITGRMSEARDPLATLVNMEYVAVTSGNHNRVKQALYNLALNHRTNLLSVMPMFSVKNPITGEWEDAVPQIDETMSPIERQREVDKFIKQMRVRMREEKDLPESDKTVKDARKVSVGSKVLPKAMPDFIVRMKVNGRQYAVVLNGNPRAAQAINGRLKEHPNKALQKISGVTRFMSAAVTAWNAAFMLSNFARDVQAANAFAYSNEGAKYAAMMDAEIHKNMSLTSLGRDLFGMKNKGIYKLYYKYRHNQLDMSNERERFFKEFVDNGGETGYTQMVDIDKIAKQMQKDEFSAIKAIKSVGKFIELANKGFENATRFAAYATSRKMGKSVMQSINDAKEISVNFNRHGNGRNGYVIAKSLYQFLNPTIQGLEKQLRTIKEHPLEGTAVLIATPIAIGFAIPLVNIGLAMLSGGGDDDKKYYWSLSDWTRRNNLIIGVNGKFIKIPLPPELRVFYGIGEMIASKMSNPYDKTNLLTEIPKHISETLPFNDTNSTFPSFVKPFIESEVTDKDFMGRKITGRSDYNTQDPEWKRAGYNTDDEYIAAAKWWHSLFTDNDNERGSWFAEINPSVAEHLIKGYTGGIGSIVGQVYTTVKAIAKGNEKDYSDSRNWPIVNRVYVQTTKEDAVKKTTNTAYRFYQDNYKNYEHTFKETLKDEKSGIFQKAQRISNMVETSEYKRYRMTEPFIKADKLLWDEIKALKETDDKESLEWIEKEQTRLRSVLVEASEKFDIYDNAGLTYKLDRMSKPGAYKSDLKIDVKSAPNKDMRKFAKEYNVKIGKYKQQTYKDEQEIKKHIRVNK